LLKLIGHYWGVRFPGLTYCQSLLAVADGVVEDLLESSQTHGANAQSATEKSVCHFEKPLALFGNVALENSVLVHICQLVKHIDTRHLYVAEN
jgi:hypothetical protein